MNKKIKYFLIGLFLVLITGGKIVAEKNYILATNADEKTYYGHLSYLEGTSPELVPRIWREGKIKPEEGVLNFPLTSGDTIDTSERGKCEIQFDTGTIIRLDADSKLLIETIMARSLSSRKRLTNLLLTKGRAYLMYKRYGRPEIFQIITPHTAVKFHHNSVAYICVSEEGSTAIDVAQGKVEILYGPNEKKQKKTKVSQGQKLLVKNNKLLRPDSLPLLAEFKIWNEDLNRSFAGSLERNTSLPLPVQKLTRAVYYFAQKYGNLYGEWVWHSQFGYVWRPFTNNYYPWGNWQPYYYGHWREVNGELFWVPDEPWGWVPYHLGVWTWHEKLGWVWIPGSAFAPAWVAWDFYFGYYSWRPWTFGDWYFYGNGYYNYLSPYYFSNLYLGGGVPYYQRKNVLRKVRKDQLKKSSSPFQMPKEWKGYYKSYIKKLEQGDENVFSRLQKMVLTAPALKPQDLNKKQLAQKVLPIQEVIKLNSGQRERDEQIYLLPESPQEVRRRVVFNYNVEELRDSLKLVYVRPKRNLNAAPKKASGKPLPSFLITSPFPQKISKEITSRNSPRQSAKTKTSLTKSSQFQVRIHDWNPDIKIGRRLGVKITYAPLNNEVRCPELRLSSGRRSSSSSGYISGRLTSSGAVYTGSSGSFALGSSSRISSAVGLRSVKTSSSSGGTRSGKKK